MRDVKLLLADALHTVETAEQAVARQSRPWRKLRWLAIGIAAGVVLATGGLVIWTDRWSPNHTGGPEPFLQRLTSDSA